MAIAAETAEQAPDSSLADSSLADSSRGDSLRSRHAKPRFGETRGFNRHGFHRLAYTDWGSARSRKLAVCVHGLMGQGRDFDWLAMALAEDGYRVICPDLVGRGRSGRLTAPEDYALQQYCTDMTALLAGFAYDRLDWIGTSLGGLIGIMMAGIANSPVSRLVLNDIGAFVSWQALFQLGNQLRAMPESFSSLARAEAYFRTSATVSGVLPDDAWRHLTQHRVSLDGEGQYRVLCDPLIAHAFNPTLLYNLVLWTYWDRINCPALLLRGAESELLTRKTAREMEQRGPHTTLVEIPGCGHAPALFTAGQIGIIASWLTGAQPA